MRYRKLLYVLDQVRTTTCSRNQHIVGGRVGLLIYVRRNSDYNQTVFKAGFAVSSVPPSGSGPACGSGSSLSMEESSLHTFPT